MRGLRVGLVVGSDDVGGAFSGVGGGVGDAITG